VDNLFKKHLPLLQIFEIRIKPASLQESRSIKLLRMGRSADKYITVCNNIYSKISSFTGYPEKKRRYLKIIMRDVKSV
jgi:hypothetical protein